MITTREPSGKPGQAPSPVADIDVATDGSSQTFRSWAAGQGEAEGRPIVVEDNLQLVQAGFPLVESEVTGLDTVTDPGTLRRHARAGLAYGARPVETWTLSVERDAPGVNVGRYRPGDWCVVRTSGHVFIPDGEHLVRLAEVSGDESGRVRLAMAPRLEGV